MTKYVISGYIGFDNFGDEAIVKVLTSHLKNLNAEKIGFPILELKEDFIDEKIQALKNIDITKYQNPKFEMPEL